MSWRSALGDPYPEVNHLEHCGDWLHKIDLETQRRFGVQLAALPLAIEVETAEGLVGLVHADCPYDDWKDMQNTKCRGLLSMVEGTLPAQLCRSCAQCPSRRTWTHDSGQYVETGQRILH